MRKAAKTVELPNDVESLKRLAIARQALLSSREVEIEKLQIELARSHRTGARCDHLPLNRQAQIYAREGVELSRLTLADWVGV